MVLYKIISSQYNPSLIGREGKIEYNFKESSENCMFYPIGGSPYRVCVKLSNIKKI